MHRIGDIIALVAQLFVNFLLKKVAIFHQSVVAICLTMATKRRSCGCKLDGAAPLGLGWQFMGQCECSILTNRKRGQEQKRELAAEQQKLAAERLMQEVARLSPDLVRPISVFP